MICIYYEKNNKCCLDDNSSKANFLAMALSTKRLKNLISTKSLLVKHVSFLVIS